MSLIILAASALVTANHSAAAFLVHLALGDSITFGKVDRIGVQSYGIRGHVDLYASTLAAYRMPAAKRRRSRKSVLAGRKGGVEISRYLNVSQPTVSHIVAQHYADVL